MKIASVLALCLVLSACGKTIPAVVSSEPGFAQNSLLGDNQASWLVGTWQAQGDSGKSLSLLIGAGDNSFVEEVQVQVGTRGDVELPSPMICRFRKTGTLKVEQSTENERTYYKEQGKTVTPELNLLTQVEKFELISDPSNHAQCATYITRANTVVPSHDSKHIKKISDSEFVNAWTDLHFKKL